MRVSNIVAFTAFGFMFSGLTACGVGTEGLYVADSGSPTTMGTGGDASHVQTVPTSDDEGGSGNPQGDDEAGNPGDEAGPADGATVAPDDAGGPTPVPDAAAPTCSSCVAQQCASQAAACGPSSECTEYRDCDLGCSSSASKTCAKTCQTTYSAGYSALASLEVCAINCGGACVAQVAIEGP
jgi:hypothetical protein